MMAIFAIIPTCIHVQIKEGSDFLATFFLSFTFLNWEKQTWNWEKRWLFFIEIP